MSVINFSSRSSLSVCCTIEFNSFLRSRASFSWEISLKNLFYVWMGYGMGRSMRERWETLCQTLVDIHMYKPLKKISIVQII